MYLCMCSCKFVCPHVCVGSENVTPDEKCVNEKKEEEEGYEGYGRNLKVFSFFILQLMAVANCIHH